MPFTSDRSPYIRTRIPQVLEAQERSQAWLARKMEVNPQHLNRVLRGHLPISCAFVRAACRALDLPPEVLFVRAEMPTGTESEAA